MLTRKTAIFAKVETVYGQDATPTALLNAILISGQPTVTPMDLKTVSRDILRPYFGNSEKLPTGVFSKLDVSVELAGSGAAGTVPGYGVLLRGCGFSETITPTTNVVYQPVTNSLESLTIYAFKDGVLHKMTGARGSVKISLALDEIPKLAFSFVGIFNPATDAAIPSNITLTAFQKPLPVTRSNTPSFSLHGYAAKLKSLDIDLAAQVAGRALVNDTESVPMTDRQPAGKIVMEATTIAQKDWWTAVKNVDLGALALVHGTQAGNKVQIDAPKVQVTNPSYGDDAGVVMLNGDLALMPNAGNDELLITVL